MTADKKKHHFLILVICFSDKNLEIGIVVCVQQKEPNTRHCTVQ